MSQPQKVIAAIACLVLSGCGGPMPSNSPEAAAGAYRDAMLNQDWNGAFSFLTREVQGTLLGSVYMQAAYNSQEKHELRESFAVVVSKHGFDRNDADKIKERGDLSNIFSDIVAFMMEKLPDKHGKQMIDELLEHVADSQYTDFKIDGDKASAKKVTADRTQSVTFVKEDDRWLMNTL